jgi:hypothetical protein
MGLGIMLDLQNQIAHRPAPLSQSRSIVQQQLSDVRWLMCLVVDLQFAKKRFVGFLLLMQFLERGCYASSVSRSTSSDSSIACGRGRRWFGASNVVDIRTLLSLEIAHAARFTSIRYCPMEDKSGEHE